MSRTCWLAMAVVLATQHSPCTAQTSLKWEFEETAYLEVRHIARQEISVVGKTKETDTTIRLLFKVRPIKVGRAATVLELTVVACEDNSVSKGAAPEKDSLKGFKGQKFRLTVSAANQGIELSGTKGLAEAVFGDDAKKGTDDEKQFAADMAETILRVHLLDAFMPLPGKAVSAGDKWRNKAEVKCQPIAHMTADREFVLVGRQIHDGKRVEAITWASKVELEPLRDEKGVLPFKIKELKPLAKSQNEGTVLWDSSRNRPVRIDCIQTYDLEMVMEINDKAVKAKGKEIAEKGFAVLDKALENKEYAVGKFSIADSAIFFVCFWAGRVGIVLPGNVAAHFERMNARPSVQRVLQQEGLA